MTREEAIKKLEHYKYCLKFQYGWYSKDDDEALDMAIQSLEQTRWISVSERLPEDGRPVLIYAWNVHHVIARYDEFRTANGYKKCWVTADSWNGNTEINHEVIAWMPLPEPYKEDERRS